MNCKFTTKHLTFFLDDEIPTWKKWLTKQHLQKCNKCQNELEKIQKSSEVLISALQQKGLNLDENELWQNISAEIPDTNAEVVKLKWKPEKVFFHKKSFYYSSGVAMILLILLVSLGRFWQKGQNQISFEAEAKTKRDYPIVESVNKENVTVMIYLTDDPKIKIVWFFED